MTFTSSPPRRRAVRQQSIAVLPPPSTMTRLPTRETWPKDTDESQSMPILICAAASAARAVRDRVRAVHRSRRKPRHTLLEQRFIESMRYSREIPRRA